MLHVCYRHFATEWNMMYKAAAALNAGQLLSKIRIALTPDCLKQAHCLGDGDWDLR